MAFDGIPAQLTVYFIKVLVIIHDILTFPIYFFIDKPWKRWGLDKITWAKLEDEKDPHSCYIRQICYESPEHQDIDTVDKLFEYSVNRYGDRKCFGTREVFGEEEETLKSGKVFKKLSLGEYRWMTYNQAYAKVGDISRGLLSLGVTSSTRVVLFAETRVEWFLTAQALFKINAPLVTLYATLGEDGLIHCINETEVHYVVTSGEQLPKIKNILPSLSTVTHVICMEGLTQATPDGIPDRVQFTLFSELEKRGKEAINITFSPPQLKDVAILMYTSGSTGVPKGVVITHENVVSSMKGVAGALKSTLANDNELDTYIAYLPLAHVFELASECYLSSVGVQVGFSSPQTLTDFSTAVKKGQKGDLTVLKPTLMVAVPVMLDRIRKSILQLAGKEGTFTHLMFDYAITYKKFWTDYGFQTARIDRKLLKTYRDFMGGRLRLIFSGSAPLSPETQSFIRCCLNVRVLQGYGLTETTACSAAMDYDDFSLGRVGAPLATCRLRLVDWIEGKYFVTDKPNPRGEIVIGGPCLALGYFKNDEATKEAFRIENGERWFYTGDIGEVFPDGTLKIIDRKKDLVKLQFGEYVALGKVEAEMKTCPLVENICVFGSFLQNFLVAIVIPNPYHLKLLAKDLGKENLSYDEMCTDEDIIRKVEETLRNHGKKSLFGSEIPRKIRLCSDEWSPESGLVTAAFKLRRKYIESHYKDIINNMYAQNMETGTHST